MLRHSIAVLLFFFLSCQLRAQQGFDFLGPVETLDNGVVTLQVALQIGRVVSYQKKSERNWLIVCDEPTIPSWHWNPWGGDRLWPTSQSLFAQVNEDKSADPVIDGKPWTMEARTPTSLVMKSGISPGLGLQVIHRIELVPHSTEVIHTYRFTRVTDSPFPVHVWTITGVRHGDFLLMESDPDHTLPENQPFKWWPDFSSTRPKAFLLDKMSILKIPWPIVPMKLGTYGRWVALVSGPRAFRESIEYHPDQPYLDATSLQVYVNPVTHTFEMENLSPAWHLKKGEMKEWTIRWKILEFPADLKSDSDQAAFLQK